jgi:hypothetical protein
VSTATAILAGQAPPIVSLCSELSPGLAALVEKAMARDPASRYQDARSMAVLLRQAPATAAERYPGSAAATGAAATPVTTTIAASRGLPDPTARTVGDTTTNGAKPGGATASDVTAVLPGVVRGARAVPPRLVAAGALVVLLVVGIFVGVAGGGGGAGGGPGHAPTSTVATTSAPTPAGASGLPSPLARNLGKLAQEVKP